MILFIFCYRKSGFSKSVRSYAFLSLLLLFFVCFIWVNYFVLIFLLFCKARNPISVNCSIVSILPPWVGVTVGEILLKPTKKTKKKQLLTCASSACCFIFMSQRDIKSSDNPFASTMHCHVSVSLPSQLATTSTRCKVFPSTMFLSLFSSESQLKVAPQLRQRNFLVAQPQ